MSDVSARTRGTEELGAGLQSLVRTLRVLFFLLRITIIVIFVWLLFSGMFFVDDQEEAMLFHFGKLSERVVDPQQGPTKVLTSGRWYWAWPYPIDTVKRVPARRSVRVTTERHFWPPINPNATDAATASIETKSLVPGQGGYLLTRDANIMHAELSVTYQVGDAQKYYLKYYHDPEVSEKERDIAKQRGVEALIRSLLCNAAIAETSLWNAEDVLLGSRTLRDADGTETSEDLRSRIEARLVAMVERMDLGINVQQVNILEVQPPLAAKAAFQRVNEAASMRDELVNNARAYEAKVLRRAEGRAREILEEANAYKTRIVESLRADRKYFEAMLVEFRKSPDTVLTALYAEKIRDVLATVKTKYVIRTSPDGNQEVRLNLGPRVLRAGSAEDKTDGQ